MNEAVALIGIGGILAILGWGLIKMRRRYEELGDEDEHRS